MNINQFPSGVSEDQFYDNLDMLRNGIETIISQDHPGSYQAFKKTFVNSNSFFFVKKELMNMLKDDFKCIHRDLEDAPEYLTIKIKLSPIANFKRWIINVCDFQKKSISTTTLYNKDFYFLKVDDQWFFNQILTNIAHEKFLLYLFQNKIENNNIYEFQTFLDEKNKITFYRDYRSLKQYQVEFDSQFIFDKVYFFQVKIERSEGLISYYIDVRNASKGLIKKIKLDDGPIQVASIKKNNPKGSILSLEDINNYKKDVLAIINSIDDEVKETNKFANISLGRICKIPVLVNLSSKYKCIKVNIQYKCIDSIDELWVSEENGELIKIFVISNQPRSNWLEKKQNS